MTTSAGMGRRLFAIALSMVGVLVLSTAPVGAATHPEVWGQTFCSETVAWLGGATAGANQLAADASAVDVTPAKGRNLLVGFLSTGVDATKSFAREVKSAGAPDITNGRKIQAAIVAGINGSAAKLAVYETAAKVLPTKNERLFSKGARKITGELDTFTDPFEKGLDKADDLDMGNQLGSILESIPECAPLARAAGGT
jgi:hypothetical protein